MYLQDMEPGDAWRQKFVALKPKLNDLRDVILDILDRSIKESGLKIHAITSRVKEEEHFIEKVERKGYGDPFAQMDDLVGARVVCYFIDDLERVRQIVANEFDVLRVEDRSETAAVDAFGYESVHYICTLRTSSSGRHYDAVKDLRFELQCRTLAQDAWANVSHRLAYKGTASIPEPLRRPFHALSALFYIADRNFASFAAEAGRVEEALARPSSQGQLRSDGQTSIDRARMRRLLHEIYPDRSPANDADVSELVEEIAAVGYGTVGAVKDKLVSAQEALASYESDRHRQLSQVGAARMSLTIADRQYAQRRRGAPEDRYERYRRLLP